MFIRHACLVLIVGVITILPGMSTAEDSEAFPGATRTAPEASRSAASAVSDPDAGQTFVVTFAVEPRLENGKLYFDVTSNLPSGMRFMAAIADDMGIINSMDATLERVDLVIQDGAMEIGPFPTWNNHFPSGEYTLYLNSYHPSRQPPEVLAVIGEKGEKMAGDYVSKQAVIFIKSFMVTGAGRTEKRRGGR
ncbi:MAG: hypothetical protein ACLFPD_11685 [Desulfosudaceae bacterium]